jgi:tetraacyldisaccharide 4'-kinase
MNWWQILLFPFAIIYDIITTCRNWAYDIGVFKTWTFDGVKIISVGNLSVGGTGKTPMVEYLIKKGITNNLKVAVLSRGYGRKKKGLIVVSTNDSPLDVGDETYGYFLEFGKKIKVVVAEKRAEGIQHIQRTFPEVQLIILDDAFQHRSVKPDFSILLSTYKMPFWRDYLLPSGRLRESRSGYSRSDVIVITKSPKDFKEITMGNQRALGIYSTVRYGDVQMMHGDVGESKVIALAGLANNEPFFDYIKSKFDLAKSFSFRDHMQYEAQHLKEIIRLAQAENATIVTTFKDSVKLTNLETMNKVNWGYIPIEVKFLKGEKDLDKLLAPYYDTSFETE